MSDWQVLCLHFPFSLSFCPVPNEFRAHCLLEWNTGNIYHYSNVHRKSVSSEFQSVCRVKFRHSTVKIQCAEQYFSSRNNPPLCTDEFSEITWSHLYLLPLCRSILQFLSPSFSFSSVSILADWVVGTERGWEWSETEICAIHNVSEP